MSILSEAQRIKVNIENAYEALSDKGAAIPAEQNSANLAEAIMGIKAEGGVNVLLTPIYVAAYKSSATSTTARAAAYVKINTKGKTLLKISGRYAKQRGGCTINMCAFTNITTTLGAPGITESEMVDNGIRAISASNSGTTLSEGEYSHEFNVTGYDEVFIKVMASWGGVTGNSYYGSAFLTVEKIIIS